MTSVDKDQQWKRKYYNSLDELEAKEKDWQELENLLRSVTIRMSLAIEGSDNSMDRNLDSLRSTLRKKPGKTELVKVIKGITNVLDELDNIKKQASQEGNDNLSKHAWQVMLKLLCNVNFPVSFKSRCHKLEAELMRCNEDSELSNQVTEFRDILIDISRECSELELNEVAGSVPKNEDSPESGYVKTERLEKKQGFFGKLFNKDKFDANHTDKVSQQESKNSENELHDSHSKESQVNAELSQRGLELNESVELNTSDLDRSQYPSSDSAINSENSFNDKNPDENSVSKRPPVAASANNLKNACQSGVDVINLLTSRLSLSGNPAQQLLSIAKRADSIENGQMLLELATDLANSLNRLWPDSDSGVSTYEVNVNEILLQLLDRLSLPPDLQQKVVVLQTKLEEVVKDEDWPELLDQIASLIGEVRKKVQAEKKDLEKFLAHLTKRLQAIDNSLQGVKEDQKSSYSHSVQLNSLLSEQMLEIRNSVQEASDLDQLKLVVDARLDAITDHMDRFRIKEQQRNQKARDRVGELTERLSVMEKETVELRNKVVKQRNLAMCDRLTGLPNRAAYDERLDQEYRRWRRFNESLCMVMIDVDHFKNINDNFGHKAGDKVLATIAAVIRDRIRETDFVARYGGEEFVALVTGAKIGDAFKVADKLRVSIESCGFHFRGARVPVTISAGIAEFRNNDTPDDVFERADKAMYEAKNNGRNCCKVEKSE